jgi:hypothetical protein
VQPSGKSDFGIDAELQSLAASPFVPEKHSTLLIQRIWLNTGVKRYLQTCCANETEMRCWHKIGKITSYGTLENCERFIATTQLRAL